MIRPAHQFAPGLHQAQLQHLGLGRDVCGVGSANIASLPLSIGADSESVLGINLINCGGLPREKTNSAEGIFRGWKSSSP